MRECLEKGEGYNHFAVDVDKISETLETMEEKYTVAQSGEFHPDSGRYAFLDTREKYKTLIELLEFGGPKTGEPLLQLLVTTNMKVSHYLEQTKSHNFALL